MNRLLIAILIATSISVVQAAERIGDFSLLDQEGNFHRLSRYSDHEAVVLLSEGGNCATFNNSVTRFAELNDQYGDQYKFLMMDATGTLDRDAVVHRAEAYGTNIPVLMDESQVISELLGVTSIGEVTVVGTKGFQVLFRGSADGLSEVLESGNFGNLSNDIANSDGGCQIQIDEGRSGNKSTASYVNDIAPVLIDRCVNCHREGGVAPFAMNNYLTVKGWSPMIKEVLMTKRMPPGQIDPHIGDVKNSRVLAPTEMQNLVHWIEAGSPRGTGNDPLESYNWPESKWPLGEPDVIVKIPAQEVPATGVMDYIWVDSGYQLPEDRWVKGADLIPGDRGVVHHILARAIPPGANGPTLGICPSPCEDGERGSAEAAGVGLPAYIPGNNARFFDEGTGRHLEAGSRLVFQMHYTTNGRATLDESEFGLYFYDEGFTPTGQINSGGVLVNSFEIPPQVGDFEVRQISRPIEKDAYLLDFYAHMHLRGKRMRFTAIYPDGSTEPLISMPNYDFNWQMTYELENPKFVPAGTKIEVVGAFDNSELNPYNPDPTKSVRWGDQSFEEMFIGNYSLKYAEN